jgi:hypothetical protein
MNMAAIRRFTRSALLGAAVVVWGLAPMPSALASDITHRALAANHTPAAVATGQDLYVDPKGSDAPDRGTTIDRPFATITYALQQAQKNGMEGGDHIYLRAGTYYPAQKLELVEHGSPQRWSLLAAYHDEHVVIDGSQVAPDDGDPAPLIRVTGSYYEISGVELVGARKSAISLYGAQVRVIGNVIRDSTWGAVWSEPGQAASLVFAHNVVYHNCLMNQPRRLAGGWPSAVNLTDRDDTVVDNQVYENYGEGLGVYGSGHHVAHNDLHDNFSAEIYLNNATRTTVDTNFIHSHGNEEYFRDWKLKQDWAKPMPFWAPSEGIAMANESATGIQFADNRVVNNIVVGPHYRALNWWNGFPQEGGPANGGMRDSLIAHNTVVSESEALFHLDDNNHSGTRIVNNIFYQQRPDRPLTDFDGVRGITFSHNLRFGGVGSAPAGEGNGPGDVEKDPDVLDPSGKTAQDYHLRPDSPAINAGIPISVNLDYFNNGRPYHVRYDIGAHEWSKDT